MSHKSDRSLFGIPLLLAMFAVSALPAQAISAEGQINAGEAARANLANVPVVTLPSFNELVRQVGKAVVNISVEGGNTEAVPGEENLPEFLRRDPQRPFMSMGSGFIIDPTGFIVTNNHVVEKSSKILVRLLDDRRDYEAKLLGRDPKTDLALIKIEASEPLATLDFGNSDNIEVGDWVLAIGNQFQLGQSVTAGIVSAKGRKLHARDASPYDSFIQTDASINPGSSGGPLLNTKGQVIGVNTAIFSPGRSPQSGIGFNIGIGFAIPVNLVRNIIEQLKEQGKVTRSFLGVIIQPVDEDVAKALGQKDAEGALVADVLPDSPAGKAGFKRKDLIVAYNGTKIRDHDDLPALVADTPVGSDIEIKIIRSGKAQTIRAKVQELTTPPAAPEPTRKPNRIGVIVGLATGGERGVVVESVEPRSDAFLAGFLVGDIIEELADKRIESLAVFDEMVKKLVKDEPVLVLVRRKEGTRFLTLTATE